MVAFRPGPLRAPLETRAGALSTHAVARRDLERYYALVNRTAPTIETILTGMEASRYALLLDALAELPEALTFDAGAVDAVAQSAGLPDDARRRLRRVGPLGLAALRDLADRARGAPLPDQ